MDTVNQILTYLKSSLSKDILLNKYRNLNIKDYTNSDFASSKVDRKSTSRYLTFLEGKWVTQKTKKQNVVSLSYVETEYRTLYHDITKVS